MNYGLQISASGVMTSMYRMDVHANNLANMETVGFKADSPSTRARPAARVEDGLHHLPSNDLLERLGAGVHVMPNLVSFTQGSLDVTEDPLHLAIQGEGFLVVSQGSGSDQARLRFTRDGRLDVDSSGRLVTATEGMAVLDDRDQPIYLNSTASFQVATDGTVTQDGEVVARLQLSEVSDTSQLQKIGNGMFTADPTIIQNRRQASGQLRQGSLERSGVDPISTLMDLQSAASGATSGSRMIQIHNDVLDGLVNRYGRVS